MTVRGTVRAAVSEQCALVRRFFGQLIFDGFHIDKPEFIGNIYYLLHSFFRMAYSYVFS